MTSQERVLKIDKVIFKLSYQSFPNKTTKSRIIHVQISTLKQYQMMMSSVARIKFIKRKVIFRYHTKGVSNQVSSKSDNKIKSIHVQFLLPKWEKTKKWETFSGLQNGGIKGLQIGTGFSDYKLGQEGLQIRVALGISNWGKKITNRGRNFKLGQRDFKSGQRLQIG